MNIRPALLTIYETHFVPLGDRLRPALSGFLSGILPGLDTGTDHFDRYVGERMGTQSIITSIVVELTNY